MSASAQLRWSALPVRDRLKVLQRARHRMAEMSARFAEAISPALARTHADTLIAELLPFLDAIRFLEREADVILRPRLLGGGGRPMWLRGVQAEIQRVPLGHILVIGPANFPLFLPGVQAMQALAAGNRVTWKPGAGGRAVALLVADALAAYGLPDGLLRVTEETVDASYEVLAQGADKVIFTGSAESGKDVLTKLAQTATPAVMELSGADAVIVLPGADLQRAANAIAFGLRLNGGAVCMSPRRLLALGETMAALRPLLDRELAKIPAVALPPATAVRLRELVEEAVAMGALLYGELDAARQLPLLIDGARPAMRIAHADIFAPVLSLMTVSTVAKFPDVYAECPYALTVAIFARESEARRLAAQLRAGTVLINDLIVPTADARVPFGGRGASGFGVTRGAEGLLEMTAAKVVLVRRGRGTRHFDATGAAHQALFTALLQAAHGRSWKQRGSALLRMFSAARRMD